MTEGEDTTQRAPVAVDNIYRGTLLKNIAVINAIDISPFALEPIQGTDTSFARVVAYARGLPGVEAVKVLCRAGFDTGDSASPISRRDWDVASMMERMAGAADGYEQVFYMYGDTPLLDTGKAEEMYRIHEKYFAQYSFADGYPVGLIPEIIETAALKIMAGLAKDINEPITRKAIFQVVQKDINAFDIETDIAARDQRILRVTLAADTRRNFMLLKRAAHYKNLQEICDYLEQNPKDLRTLPAYVMVQIVDGCPQACSYCPWPMIAGDVQSLKSEMEPKDFRTVVEKVAGFCGDATLALSLWGEPSRHTRIGELAQIAGQFPGISLMIETSGVGWRQSDVDEVLRHVGDRTEWIVSLDSVDPDMYRDLRGDGMQESAEFAKRMIAKASLSVYVQAVRMNENEPRMQDFYRFWKQYTEHIIIQKYDAFCGFLPQRKVTDLSPLKRFPCWHLKRDVHVLIDGSVPVCREDLKNTQVLGNLFTDSIEEIWRQGEAWYLRHIDGDYPELCKGCDEYYTYNF